MTLLHRIIFRQRERERQRNRNNHTFVLEHFETLENDTLLNTLMIEKWKERKYKKYEIDVKIMDG